MKLQFCKRGHDTFKFGRNSSNNCLVCKQLQDKINRNKHSDKYYEYGREWHWRQQGIKITYEEYQTLLNKQNQSCAICLKNRNEFKSALHVDHDHHTGKVRGLLCLSCNVIVGRLDNTDYRKKVLEYAFTL